MKDEQRCELCSHWRAKQPEEKTPDGIPIGECRRNPPQMIVLSENSVQSLFNKTTARIEERQVLVQKPVGCFPHLKATDPGCGEFTNAD